MDFGLLKTKVGKLFKNILKKRMKLCVFATSNQVERLSLPLRSRFMELHLEEYNYEEFVNISQRLLKNRYRLNMEIAERIAYLVWIE